MRVVTQVKIRKMLGKEITKSRNTRRDLKVFVNWVFFLMTAYFLGVSFSQLFWRHSCGDSLSLSLDSSTDENWYRGLNP